MSILLTVRPKSCTFFFFNDTATTEIYTLSLHDALPISARIARNPTSPRPSSWRNPAWTRPARSEEHTSELQSQSNLVCRLLLEKKKMNQSLIALYSVMCWKTGLDISVTDRLAVSASVHH